MAARMTNHWVTRALFYTRIGWIVLHLFLIGYVYRPHHAAAWNLVLLFGVIAGAVPQLVWLKVRERWMYPVTELVVSGLYFLTISYLNGHYFSYLAIPALCAAAMADSTRLRIPLWFWFSIMSPIGLALVVPFSSFNMSIIEGVFFFGLGVGVWKMLDTHRKMQELLAENERQRGLLEQHARQVERLTLLEERNRLARELHDTVGHTLTTLVTGLDAAGYLIAYAPGEARRSVQKLREVAHNGLDDVRRQIHHIAPERENGTLAESLRQIVEEFAVNTGTEVVFETAEPDSYLALPQTMTLVRCLQESLTNAKRHGKASRIAVSLKENGDFIMMTVRDNGVGMPVVRPGFGLSAMRERLSTYYGELQIESGSGSGTTIVCRLPKGRQAEGTA